MTAIDKTLELMQSNLIPRPYRQRGLAGAALWLYKASKLTWTEFQTVRNAQLNGEV